MQYAVWIICNAPKDSIISKWPTAITYLTRHSTDIIHNCTVSVMTHGVIV